MKKLYLLLAFFAVTLVSCTKEILVPAEGDVYEWTRNHEKGTVAYVDYYTGNYIVETYRGYSVVEAWGGITPREYDTEYASFSHTGSQTTYNYNGNYFGNIYVRASWLNWSDALYMIDRLSY